MVGARWRLRIIHPHRTIAEEADDDQKVEISAGEPPTLTAAR